MVAELEDNFIAIYSMDVNLRVYVSLAIEKPPRCKQSEQFTSACSILPLKIYIHYSNNFKLATLDDDKCNVQGISRNMAAPNSMKQKNLIESVSFMNSYTIRVWDWVEGFWTM